MIFINTDCKILINDKGDQSIYKIRIPIYFIMSRKSLRNIWICTVKSWYKYKYVTQQTVIEMVKEMETIDKLAQCTHMSTQLHIHTIIIDNIQWFGCCLYYINHVMISWMI